MKKWIRNISDKEIEDILEHTSHWKEVPPEIDAKTDDLIHDISHTPLPRKIHFSGKIMVACAGIFSMIIIFILAVILNRIFFSTDGTGKDKDQAQLQIISITGDVFITRNNKTTLLSMKELIYQGDMIRTNEYSSCVIRFYGGFQFTMMKNTKYLIAISGKSELKIELYTGELIVDALKSPLESGFEIHTEEGTIQAHGSECIIRRLPGGITEVDTLGGVLTVDYSLHGLINRDIIRAGERVIITPDKIEKKELPGTPGPEAGQLENEREQGIIPGVHATPTESPPGTATPVHRDKEKRNDIMSREELTGSEEPATEDIPDNTQKSISEKSPIPIEKPAITVKPTGEPEKKLIFKESVTINIGLFDIWESAFTKIFNSKEFTTTFPNVTIRMETSPFVTHHERLKKQLQEHKATNDIEAFEIGYIPQFMKSSGLTDLSQPPYNGIEAGKNLVPFCMSYATTADGKLIGMPLDFSPLVLYYRESIASKYNADFSYIPDWEAYIQEAKRIVIDSDKDRKIDQYVLSHPVDLARALMNGKMYRWVDEMDNPLQPESIFTNVLQLLKDVRDAKISANILYWSEEWVNSLKTGKVVTHCGGTWLNSSLKDFCAHQRGDWRVGYMPGQLYAVSGGTYLSVPSHIPEINKMIACQIIHYLCTNKEAQLTSLKLTGVFPVLTTVYDDPLISEPDSFFGGQKVRELYRDIALHIPLHSASVWDIDAMEIFDKVMWDVFSNSKTVNQAYTEAKNKIQRQIKKAKKRK